MRRHRWLSLHRVKSSSTQRGWPWVVVEGGGGGGGGSPCGGGGGGGGGAEEEEREVEQEEETLAVVAEVSCGCGCAWVGVGVDRLVGWSNHRAGVAGLVSERTNASLEREGAYIAVDAHITHGERTNAPWPRRHHRRHRRHRCCCLSRWRRPLSVDATRRALDCLSSFAACRAANCSTRVLLLVRRSETQLFGSASALPVCGCARRRISGEYRWWMGLIRSRAPG
jgi:hypothetical protein